LKVYKNKEALSSILKGHLKQGDKIGFVPTMGALHKGHLSLIQKAKEENSIIVVSLFVNPTQFTNSEDYENYPRMEEKDMELLSKAGVDVVFAPEKEDIYGDHSSTDRTFDLGHLEMIMEGKYRPGHFQGVANIVHRLFEIVQPHRSYFGQKDYQQLAVIQKLKTITHASTQIIGCPTVREKDGLAMSSRNLRLNKTQRMQAPAIYKLLSASEKKLMHHTIADVKQWMKEEINRYSELHLEYFEISDTDSLMPAEIIEKSNSYVGCIAVYAGNIRLIDNIVYIF
jgi:pantoate--beta-alanine ligase